MDCSLPDSSIHGIFQARVLEWGDAKREMPKVKRKLTLRISEEDSEFKGFIGNL